MSQPRFQRAKPSARRRQNGWIACVDAAVGSAAPVNQNVLGQLGLAVVGVDRYAVHPGQLALLSRPAAAHRDVHQIGDARVQFFGPGKGQQDLFVVDAVLAFVHLVRLHENEVVRCFDDALNLVHPILAEA